MCVLCYQLRPLSSCRRPEGPNYHFYLISMIKGSSAVAEIWLFFFMQLDQKLLLAKNQGSPLPPWPAMSRKLKDICLTSPISGRFALYRSLKPRFWSEWSCGSKKSSCQIDRWDRFPRREPCCGVTDNGKGPRWAWRAAQESWRGIMWGERMQRRCSKSNRETRKWLAWNDSGVARPSRGDCFYSLQLRQHEILSWFECNQMPHPLWFVCFFRILVKVLVISFCDQVCPQSAGLRVWVKRIQKGSAADECGRISPGFWSWAFPFWLSENGKKNFEHRLFGVFCLQDFAAWMKLKDFLLIKTRGKRESEACLILWNLWTTIAPFPTQNAFVRVLCFLHHVLHDGLNQTFSPERRGWAGEDLCHKSAGQGQGRMVAAGVHGVRVRHMVCSVFWQSVICLADHRK